MENNNKKSASTEKSGTGRDKKKRPFYHINRETLPLKVTLFLYYGAMSAILPYLTIHMKDIGISLSQIAIIYAVLPFTAFLGPPILGFLADKLGQYKSVLIVATIINGLFHTLLLFVPKYSETAIYTTAVIEFRGQGGAYLHPATPDLCHNFGKSLLSAESRFRNSVINVHSCNTSGGDDDPTIFSNFTSRGLGGGGAPELKYNVSWNIPESCRVEPLPDLYDTEDSEVAPEFSCGDDDDDDEEDVESEEAPLSRGVGGGGGTESDSKCSVRVNMNSHQVGVGNSETISCQTNYTFESEEKITSGNGPLTFWLYFLFRIIGNVFMNACFSLLDATTLAVVGNSEGAEYGRERILCTIGFAVISPLAGLLVDRVSAAKGYTDYSAAFYFADVMLLINIVGYFYMTLSVEKPEGDFMKNATDLLNYPEVVVFLGMIFILGNMWGFVESYLFIFLDELKAPKYLLGLTLTVGSLAGVPFLWGAETLVAKAGRVNIIVLAFIVYFVRFFGYSYIPNPFWCFPFEAMEAFTYHLMWVAAATYCAVLAPKGLLATLTGVMGSLHYGLGKGSGAFIGGYFISVTSTRLAFRYFGVVAGLVGVVYFAINKCWLEGAIKRRTEREIESAVDTDVKPKQNEGSKVPEEPVEKEAMLA